MLKPAIDQELPLAADDFLAFHYQLGVGKRMAIIERQPYKREPHTNV